MPKSRKQPKTRPQETPNPDLLENPPESEVSVDLASEEPLTLAASPDSPPAAAAAPSKDERPGIDLISPPDGHVVGPPGDVVVCVRVSRSGAGIPLARVEWYLDGRLVGTNRVLRNVESYEVCRTIRIPAGTHEVQAWLWNLTGPGRNHRIRHYTCTGAPAGDKTPPTFAIASPKDGATVRAGAPLVVHGWAADPSGVAAVEWSLDGAAYQAASLTADPGNSSRVNWRFELQNVAAGPHALALRFRDRPGNAAAAALSVTAVEAYRPKDDLVSLRAYLEDLLWYASTHVTVGKTKLTDVELTKLFYQPFQTLRELQEQQAPLGSQPMNQLRAAIEVLRKYLADGSAGPLTNRPFEQVRRANTPALLGNGKLSAAAALPGPVAGGALLEEVKARSAAAALDTTPAPRWEEDRFDALALGRLSGQNGWVAAVPDPESPLVVADPDNPSNKVLATKPKPKVTVSISKSLTPQTSGRHSFRMRVKAIDATNASLAKIEVQTTPGQGFGPGADKKLQIFFGSSMRVNHSSAPSVNIVNTTTMGRWYDIRCEMDLDAKLLDVYVDETAAIRGVALQPGPIVALNIAGWDLPGSVYLDNLYGMPRKLNAHWKLDEGSGTTTTDASGNGSTGTLQGPTWTTGRFGGALRFDGVDDYVQADRPGQLAMDSALSLCAWIYPQGPGTADVGGIIMCKEGEYAVARFPDGSIQWALANANPGWKFINTGYIAPPNHWTHIAVVYDNGTITTYADGQPVHTLAGAGAIVSHPQINDLRIGGRQASAQHFHGLIDDVRLYSYPLSADAITAIAPPLAQLLAHWTFDEGSGTTTADVTGNGSNGVLKGPAWTTGQVGGALRFDGVDDRVSLPKITCLDKLIDNFTVAFWARPEATHTIVAEGASDTSDVPGQRYVIEPEAIVSASGSVDAIGIGVSVSTNGISVYEHVDGRPLALLVHKAAISGWTHIAVIFRDKQPTLHVNGKLVRTGQASQKQSVRIRPVALGGESYGHFDGQLDDLRIYDRPLSEDEFAALMSEYVFAAAEARYRSAAYQALLTRIGTSDEEIRLARGAEAETRKALAARLGITLDPDNDQLEQLHLAAGRLTEARLEELFGLADTTRDPLTEGGDPLLLRWRREHLEALWIEQDWPSDPYMQEQLPFVDPDLIGPDDLRRPAQGAAPFDLWQDRREWVDKRWQAFLGMKTRASAPDLAAMFSHMYQPLPDTPIAAWKGSQPSDFDQLRDKTTQTGDDEARTSAIETIKNDLNLSVESFSRLLSIRDKAALAAGDPRNEQVSDEEWEDIYSILVQAQKVALFRTWIDQERAQGVMLDPRQFWISLREPKEGAWPPTLPPGHPLIDPDVLKQNDLLESALGKRAVELWQAHRSSLAQINKDLKQARETAGFEAMLRLALGHEKPGDPLQHDLDALKNDLNSRDQERIESATQKIAIDLRLNVADFNRLMWIKAEDKAGQTDPHKKPTAADYAEAYAILTQARKVKHEFSIWIADEQSAELKYWMVLRARLPGWRASVTARQQWQQALRTRSGAPLIDPDLIGLDDLKRTVKGDSAFDLWQARAEWLAGVVDELRKKCEEQPDALAGFDTVVSETLGVPTAALLELETKRKQGADIEPELKQLLLTWQLFARLLRVRRMADSNTVSEVEWADIYHILAQVRKQQQYQVWRAEEINERITLTPRLFKLSETAPALPPWRATWRARLDWRDRLWARIAQLQAIEDGIRAAVSAVEEQTLPVLRDALVIGLASRWGLEPADTAEWLTHRLLVDLKTNASQRTTRLIQAIQTVGGVLFALRAGQLAPEHPAATWKLAVPEGHFDEEWQWMGSYATWRAAMIVFFFPETVLLPSLRLPYDAKRPLDLLNQTSQFESLIKELRKRPRLTPDQARREAAGYLDNLLKDMGVNFKPPALKTAIEASRPSPKEAPAFLSDWHTDETLGKLQQLCRDVFASFGSQPVPNYIHEIFYGVPLELAWQLQKSGAHLAALDWYQTVYAYNLPLAKRKIYHGLERETNVAPILSRTEHWLIEGLNPHVMAASRIGSNPHTRYTLMSLSQALIAFADSEFTHDTAESLTRALELYLTAQRLLFSPDLETSAINSADATLLVNPQLDLLRMRVDIQLTKLRDGRNIAGMKRQVALPISLPPGVGDLPTIGAGGQLIIPGARPALRPTPYYFRVLLERSKQLVNIAQQIEAAYLAALEKRDAENYNLLKAHHDLELAQASEELQNRRVQEAQAGVGVARAQHQRAVFVSQEYRKMSQLDLNQYEKLMLDSYRKAIDFIGEAGDAGAEAARLSGEAAYYNAKAAEVSSFMPIDVSFKVGGVGIGGSPIPNFEARNYYRTAGSRGRESGRAQAAAAIASASAQRAQMDASIYGIQASHEWRKKEWELQAAIAEQDIAIGAAQVHAAHAHVEVAEQERQIARIQVTQAQAVADFLAKKFTNAELYEWMSGVLGEVYSYFLQQATAIAQLAENQLAFDRQDTPPRFIRADYWEMPSANGLISVANQQAPDRQGLTGSARLLRDIHQLDQYAFDTDKRKLNLSQTFSLARMAPYDFELFRESGVLEFETPMRLFDQDFPGHYLRLIKRVRVTVIALIPPHQGIRAALTASGISRVVTGGDIFQQVVVRRDPELVALTSPTSATGVFEMDVQPEMLLPFESMGVDTRWQFELPRAANPFDFRTIADVLITIEYTALNSFEYRRQVIQALNPRTSGERSFIFTSLFADAWYDLHNPEQSATPMTVTFKTWRGDFPANIEELKIEQVLLFFSRAVDELGGEKPFEVEVKNLGFTTQGSQNAFGGGATTIDGMISTRRGNGSSWSQMIGKSPVGEWELELPDAAEVKRWFKEEKIQEILLVITYGGLKPAWPT
jgi:hypothetical protein